MASPQRAPAAPDVAPRLLDAWRAEIEASTVYALLVKREKDPRRADILRRMAESEEGHRQRLEARMTELGIAIPDRSQVRLSPWLALQARVAPVGRLLAQREAAEAQDIAERYTAPTGDAKTDELLAAIRAEEESHAGAIRDLQQGQTPSLPTPAPADGRAGTQARLNRILGREKWHQGGTGWIAGAIYGANDGLAAVFGIIAGVSAATGESRFVLTAGLSGAVASAVSMATGAFLAERSQAEVSAANLARERREIEEHPEEEKEELSLFYQLKGMPKADADEMAERLSRTPDAMLNVLAAEELGGAKAAGNPVEAAVAAGVSTGVGAIIPVLPFFFMHGLPAMIVAAIVSLIAHFIVGALKSLVTLRSWWSSGLEMTLAGAIVGGVLYGVGLLFKVPAQ
ncbi:MAG: VIT1/CCC1 transporter family protein [Candidatus Eremiobacteraeota bacterium]|nr:VIT1/CCC1 transporter family protein [Candidatus Eremiobacteraeota bacterium]MBV8203706.1 VIT1/CCC1 transporter family protein [Candidatus Eremiobacteraeota bacterium]MBV8338414.1 VIT1/CCC1 transporter family protein [Candidatus Eremiobacteraeota bacterium]MBV8459650.1 VIT1/CCC1 transporter family protein [Candidatus Eremiobacteraeota bacterium]MBV8595309.1 VIT1/CCC1 transporter family protein [Candidatus Eremiobacteraeota bacterium]